MKIETGYKVTRRCYADGSLWSVAGPYHNLQVRYATGEWTQPVVQPSLLFACHTESGGHNVLRVNLKNYYVNFQKHAIARHRWPVSHAPAPERGTYRDTREQAHRDLAPVDDQTVSLQLWRCEVQNPTPLPCHLHETWSQRNANDPATVARFFQTLQTQGFEGIQTAFPKFYDKRHRPALGGTALRLTTLLYEVVV